MKVAVDTNILFSALMFPGSFSAQVFYSIMERYDLVLSTYVLDEIREVIHRKFPLKVKAVDDLLLRYPHEIVYSPSEIPEPRLFNIRDDDDYMVLYSAILAEVDVLVTGDKDFDDVQIETPEICSPRDFSLKYLS